ncbi:hypothetical protein D9M71_439800 [compost metagenome]
MLESAIESIDIALRLTVTDEDTQLLRLSIVAGPSIQITADLVTRYRAVQTWADRAGKTLATVTGIHPAPACREGAGLMLLALVALAFMESTECIEQHLIDGR